MKTVILKCSTKKDPLSYHKTRTPPKESSLPSQYKSFIRKRKKYCQQQAKLITNYLSKKKKLRSIREIKVILTLVRVK
jgi:hypothetical protein